MNIFRRHWLYAALFLITCSFGLSGCQSLNLPGFPVTGPTNPLHNNLRAPGSLNQAAGVSSEARQIEKNLGI